jgi:acylphosphatase
MNNYCQKFIVSGLVQGVGFRYFTSHEGLKLGLTGYAKNLNNGDVEVVACGGLEQVEALYLWLHQGSPAAQVIRVERLDLECDKRYKGFTVQY